MRRLIDANALAKFIDYGHLNNPDEKLYSENDIREMIDMMPTITEPVRHGKWIREVRYTIDSLHSYQQYRCSECGMTYITNTKHCPNCGADMRGTEDGDK